MREKPSTGDYGMCSFMANYGFHCGKDECRARALVKSGFLGTRSKLPADERERMRSEIVKNAAASGCPVYSDKTETQI